LFISPPGEFFNPFIHFFLFLAFLSPPHSVLVNVKRFWSFPFMLWAPFCCRHAQLRNSFDFCGPLLLFPFCLPFTLKHPQKNGGGDPPPFPVSPQPPPFPSPPFDDPPLNPLLSTERFYVILFLFSSNLSFSLLVLGPPPLSHFSGHPSLFPQTHFF